MLDNFTVGDRFELARGIGISENSPDLEKFAEYLAQTDKDREELEDEIWELERQLRNRDDEICELKAEIAGYKNILSEDD